MYTKQMLAKYIFNLKINDLANFSQYFQLAYTLS